MKLLIVHRCSLLDRSLALAAVVLVTGVLVTGCGSNTESGQGGSGSGPVAGKKTSVTLLASSTANDQLSEFELTFGTITLTSKSGETVSLMPENEHVEFIHLNGGAEPLLTVSVSQNVYTSATATIGPATFTCLGQIVLSSGDHIDSSSTYAYGKTPDAQVTVKLPAPVTISGASMGLSLNLLVSASANWSTSACASNPLGTFTITPAFSLTPVQFLSQPTAPLDGRMSGLDGIISTVNSGGTFTVTAADGSLSGAWDASLPNSTGPQWQVETNSSTVFQDVSGLPALAAGMNVDFDGVLQPDGSVLATRIATEDPDPTNLSLSRGPLVVAYSSEPLLSAMQSEQLGYFANTTGRADEILNYSYDNATFQISGQFANLLKLPFAATFDATSMVAGQMISITTHATSVSKAPVYIPASTVTLVPQTINGTVNSISTSGSFTVYTVALAPYDLFPQFAAQGGQTTLLNDPGTVVVYADSSSIKVNGSEPTAGSLMRFTGLVFNDNGTLRMDCAAINDGVPESGREMNPSV